MFCMYHHFCLGTFVFFAADSADFAWDTGDGKNTTHGTITLVYQRVDSVGYQISPPLSINHTVSESVYNPISYTHATLSEVQAWHIPKSDENVLFTCVYMCVEETYCITQLGWCFASVVFWMRHQAQVTTICQQRSSPDRFLLDSSTLCECRGLTWTLSF